MRFILQKILFFVYVLTPMLVFADPKFTPVVPPGPAINPAADISNPGTFLMRIQNILGWAFAFALILGVAMLIVAGIMYITAAGSSRAETAVKIMIAAIVGIAITGFAWAIVNVIQGLFFTKTVDVGGSGTIPL